MYNCAIVCWLLLVLILMFLVAKAKFGFDVALLATKCDFKAITAMFLVGFFTLCTRGNRNEHYREVTEFTTSS